MVDLFFRIRNCLNSSSTLSKVFTPLLLLCYRTILLMYGSSIPLNTKFSDAPNFPHGLYGVFISGDAELGEGITIFQQVTIGSISTKGSKYIGAPKISSGVILGAGAKVLGGIIVGKNARIGSNCVVVNDISAEATAVLSTIRIIEKS